MLPRQPRGDSDQVTELRAENERLQAENEQLRAQLEANRAAREKVTAWLSGHDMPSLNGGAPAQDELTAADFYKLGDRIFVFLRPPGTPPLPLDEQARHAQALFCEREASEHDPPTAKDDTHGVPAS